MDGAFIEIVRAVASAVTAFAGWAVGEALGKLVLAAGARCYIWVHCGVVIKVEVGKNSVNFCWM